MEELVTYPDTRLTRVATPCANHKVAQAIADELLDVCKRVPWGNCVGMAAPQIGVPKRVFVALGEVYINPKLVWTSPVGWRYFLEGCYSLEPKRYDYKVRRPHMLTLAWTDYSGNSKRAIFTGEQAQIIAHEFDHLEGRLCNGESE